jgi:hypothetical protein
LYVKKHFSGDPICRLSPGSKLEICFENKTVSGGACNFYIKKVTDTYNGMIIDLALDNVSWAPKYAELMINAQTQNFGFVIGNNSGAYSYLNEADMEKNKELEQVNLQKIQEQNKLEDENTVLQINKALEEKKYFLAYDLLSKLSTEHSTIKKQVLDNWNPLKQEIDELYKDYLSDFESYKTTSLEQYQKNPTEFIENNKAMIKKVNKQYKGFENINSALEKGLKVNDLAYLGKSNNKYFFFPMGIGYHYSSRSFDTMDVDQIILNTKYNQITEEIDPEVSFYKQNKRRYEFKIINTKEFSVNSITYNYSEVLNKTLNKIISEGGSSFISNTYQQKTFLFDSKEIISFLPKKASEPKDGYQNKEYNDLYSIYSEIQYPIYNKKPDFVELYLKGGGGQSFNVLLNPSILSKIQKIKDISKSDSIILIFGKDLPQISNTISLVPLEQWYSYKEGGWDNINVETGRFYFLPIKKGSIELIGESNLRFYNTNGNYKEYKFDMLCETYTEDKINELLTFSSELKKRLKKNKIEYQCLSYYSIKNRIELDYFLYTNDIIIPIMSCYRAGLPKPDMKFSVVVNK